MALVKFARKSSSLFLQPRLQSLVPSTYFRTTASLESRESDGYKDPEKEKAHEDRIWRFAKYFYTRETDEKGDLGYPEVIDITTGMEKKELELRAAGVEDIFDMKAMSRGDKGSKLDPIRIPGAFESRMIACRCYDRTQNQFFPMWLHQNEPKRCRCGFWFVLFYKEPFCDYSIPQ